MTKVPRREFLMGAAASVAAPLVMRAQTATTRKNRSPFSASFLAQLPRMMEWSNVPGVAIAVLKDGELSWSGGFGVKRAGEPEKVTTDTLFGAASLSKPVLAFAVLGLRDKGMIDLDRPLWNYLPYDDLPAGEQGKQITARHVLGHSTGLQNWRFNRDQKLEFAFKAGERFQYSGEGYYYLQRVIEKITGRGFESYMQETVLKPLGMRASTFSWTAEAASRMSSGHGNRMQPLESFNAQRGKQMLRLAQEWKKPIEAWTHEDAVRAEREINKDSPAYPNSLLPNTAGSLITTVDEYARFMSRLMSNKRDDERDISESSKREMLTLQSKINSDVSWGLGVGLETYAGRQMFWHWGDNGSFKAFMMGSRSTGAGVIVFANAQNGHRIWQRVAAEAMGRDHPAFYFYMT